MANFRVQLEQLAPNVSLSVELPHNGNGNLYQARTTLEDGLIFYGRAETEDDAVLKCCQKAVKHLQKSQDNWNANNNRNYANSSRPPRKCQPAMNRRNDENMRPPRRAGSKASTRELELRSEMGDVLDRVLEWNRRYGPRKPR